MKTGTKLSALTIILELLALCGRAGNYCTETGPHYNGWNCYQAPTLSSAAYISPNSITVLAGETIPQPQAYNLIITNGVEYQSVTYDCSPWEDYDEFQNQANTASSLYFDPPLPSSIHTSGTYTYTAKIDITSSDGLCPTTVTVGTLTVHVVDDILDVDIGGRTSSLKTGYAAVGASTNDFWNEAGTNNVADLEFADGSFSSVGLLVTNMIGISNNGSSDPMFDDYIYGDPVLPVGQSVTITLTNLPAGIWNVYLYASDGSFDLSAGGVDYGTQNCFDRFPASQPIWRQGVHYVLYSDVTITNGQNLTVNVLPGASGTVMISGLQITTALPAVPVGLPQPVGLAAWWRAEDNALDSIGTNKGTLVNGVTFEGGMVGRAFSLAGTNYVSVLDSPALDPTNAMTIECWLYRQSQVGIYDPVVKKQNSAGTEAGYSLEFKGNYLAFWICNTNGSWIPSGSFSGFITNEQWHHVAGVYDGTHVYCYIDGRLASSFPASGNIAVSTNVLCIGHDPGNSDRFFNGLLDEVSFYDRALSSNEIAAIFNAGPAGKYIDSDYDGRSDYQEWADQTDPNDPDDFLHVQLGHWRFDNTNTWIGDEGQFPLACTNVVGVPGLETNAVLIDSTNVAFLTYHEVDTNGANINLRHGTIRFWFKPDWNSVSGGGAGPGDQGRMIEMGSQGTGTGWWSLLLDTNGDEISLITQTNGISQTNLTTAISWTSNSWHQVVLTYGVSNSTLYIDGQVAVTNGLGSQYWPNATERSAGFHLGSDGEGNNQARGAFDELETYNYPLNSTNALDSDGDGLPDWWEYEYFGNLDATANGDNNGDGINNLQKYQEGLNPVMLPFNVSITRPGQSTDMP